MDPLFLPRRDLRRLAAELWKDPRCESIAAAVVGAAEQADASSLDRTLVLSYLRYFPRAHPAFDDLRAAAGRVAERRDWPWRARGREWDLWNPAAGPAKVAEAMLDADDGFARLSGAGLDGDLAQGGFAGAALESACLRAGAAQGAEAQVLGERLMALFARSEHLRSNGLLAWALLAPWQNAAATETYRKSLARSLVEQFDDPRIKPALWNGLSADVKEKFGVDLAPLTIVLKRWLTENTVRAFFSIVRKTTDRLDQWDARENFWIGYLDQGVVNDAWFALGRNAKSQAGPLAEREGMASGTVSGGADPSHSALIMTIGNLRIAEWSHNGSCRFWPNPDIENRHARKSQRPPEPYKRGYDGTLLRTTSGPPDFEYVSHTTRWQSKFAAIIYRHTGIAHPRYGRGL